MTEQDLKNIPLSELTKMVESGTTQGESDTQSPQNHESTETSEATKSEEKAEDVKAEDVKEEDVKEEEDKETNEQKLTGVKKLLHQRSELRQDNDRLKTELEEAREQLRKIKSGELDSEFFDAAGEVDAERKAEAIQDAKMKNLLIERDYNQSNNRITNSREVELAQFFIENPDLGDIKTDIIDYAERHKDLDIEDVKYLVLSRLDPTRLLDQQTRNKLKGGFDIPGDSYVPETKEKSPQEMTSKELLAKVKELGLI